MITAKEVLNITTSILNKEQSENVNNHIESISREISLEANWGNRDIQYIVSKHDMKIYKEIIRQLRDAGFIVKEKSDNFSGDYLKIIW